MSPREHTVLVVSDDAELCLRTRRELERRNPRLHVTSVRTVDAARQIVEGAAPAVIALEESSMRPEALSQTGKMPSLEPVVAWLAGYAPVVVVGPESRGEELATLVAAGVADYVKSSSDAWRQMIDQVALRLAKTGETETAAPAEEQAAQTPPVWCADFGELLRHELNNPLTGILGNAELLLAEIRRKDDGRLPQGGAERLETIADLAVRLRETVWRLSQEWEARQDTVRSR